MLLIMFRFKNLFLFIFFLLFYFYFEENNKEKKKQGMQVGEDRRYLKMVSGLKHFTAYSVESGRSLFFSFYFFSLYSLLLSQHQKKQECSKL